MKGNRAFPAMPRFRIHFDLINKHPAKVKHTAAELAIYALAMMTR
jgi:hypothetical protein